MPARSESISTQPATLFLINNLLFFFLSSLFLSLSHRLSNLFANFVFSAKLYPIFPFGASPPPLRTQVAEGSDLTSRNNRGNTAIMVADAWDQTAMVKLLKTIAKRSQTRVLHQEAEQGARRAEDAVLQAKATYARQSSIEADERAYLMREIRRQTKIQEVEWRAARSEAKAKDRMRARARATRAAQATIELKRELNFRLAQEREHLHYLPQEEELLHRKKLPFGGRSGPSPLPPTAGAASLFAPSTIGAEYGRRSRSPRSSAPRTDGAYGYGHDYQQKSLRKQKSYGSDNGVGFYGGMSMAMRSSNSNSNSNSNLSGGHNSYRQQYMNPSPSIEQQGPHSHFNPNGHYDPHGRYMDHTAEHLPDGVRYNDVRAHQYHHQGKGRYVEVEHHVPRKHAGVSPNPPRPHYVPRAAVPPPKPGFQSSASRGLTLPEARTKASRASRARPLQHIEYSHTPTDIA